MSIKFSDLPPKLRAMIEKCRHCGQEPCICKTALRDIAMGINPKGATSAKALTTPPDDMNKLERSYAAELERQRVAGAIKAFVAHPGSFKLGRKCFYHVDFLVIGAAGEVEYHETKGFMRDDAAVKLKVAARMFPWFVFKLVRRKKGAWLISRF